MGPRQSKSYPPHHPAIDPNSDTGRNLQAVADAAAEGVLDRTPGVTSSECKLTAMSVVEEYHEKHCPSKDLGKKLDDFVGEFVEFRGEIKGQLRMVMWGVPLLLTLGGLLVTGVWRLASSQVPRPVHSHVIQDAGQSVAAGPSFSLIPSAQAATNK
jgi:hypothetical protein